jgi:hypothetical protein
MERMKKKRLKRLTLKRIKLIANLKKAANSDDLDFSIQQQPWF